MPQSVAFIVFISAFLSLSQIFVRPAAAESDSELRYISDLLVISIRDKVEKPSTAVGVVRSGDPVRIIEEQDNFYKIETQDKKQGWIGKQYLKKEMPDSVSVQQLKEEVANLKKQLETRPTGDASTVADKGNNATELCAALQQKLNDAEKQVQQLHEQQRKMAANPAASPENSESSAQLEETSLRYNQLIAEYENRGKEIAELQNSIAKHDDTTRFLWFGAGAGVFFLGLLAGRSANRKKNKFIY